MRKGMGIDFGAEAVRVSLPSGGIVERQPSVIAEDKESGEIVRFGESVPKLVEQNPDAYRLRWPFRRDYLLSEPALVGKVLAHFLESAYPGESDVRLLLSIPCGLTDEEEYALAEIAAMAGFGGGYLVYAPLAALVGAGCSLEKTFLAVDVGAMGTDVLVVSDGEIVYRASHAVGGEAFSYAIADYVFKKHRLRIRHSQAEKVKHEIGTVWLDEEKRRIEIIGMDESRAVHRRILSSDEMFEALEEPCAELLDAICTAATKVPLDAVPELVETGISLFGGGALLRGLSEMIAGVTGFRVTLCDKPTDAVAEGLAKILPTLPARLIAPNVSMIAAKTNSYLNE